MNHHNWQTKILNSTDSLTMIKTANAKVNFNILIQNSVVDCNIIFYDFQGAEINNTTIDRPLNIKRRNSTVSKIEFTDSSSYNIIVDYQIITFSAYEDYNCTVETADTSLAFHNPLTSDGSLNIRSILSDINSAGLFKSNQSIAPVDISKTTNSGGNISVSQTGSQIAINSTSLIVKHVQFVNSGVNQMFIGVGSAVIPLYPNWVYFWDALPTEQTDLKDWVTKGTSGDNLEVNYQV